jgi:5,10-methylenetetrahydromethanopterin reductase
MEISCAIAPGPDSPAHIEHAESLGFTRAWVYDSPAVYYDPYMTLALAAGRTSRIGLGPGVLIPSLRHPMTTASAMATLENLAPGRTFLAVGAGNTGRVTLGQRPLRWSDVRIYLAALKELLAGSAVEYEGALMQFILPADREVEGLADIPIVVGSDGPKGLAVAKEFADGVIGAQAHPDFAWSATLVAGTVLEEGEDFTSSRAVAAAGPMLTAWLHYAYEGQVPLGDEPAVAAWAAELDAIPAARRHLEMHREHLVGVLDRDRPLITPERMGQGTLTGGPGVIRQRVDELAASGITEVVYQPAGPDIHRELAAFYAAAIG